MADKRKPDTALLAQLKDTSDRTPYALAISNPGMDEEVTVALAAAIKKNGEALSSLAEKSLLPELSDFTNRSTLMHGYIEDETTPPAIREIFKQAANMEQELLEPTPSAINSMDIHHFAGEIDDAGTFKITQKSRTWGLTDVMAYTTLLMNPVNPVYPTNENDQELPLRDGRMKRHAGIISEVSGHSKEDLLKATFINVSNIAGWRYKKSTTAEQALFDIYIQCAERANDIGNLGVDPTLFPKALEEHTALTNG